MKKLLILGNSQVSTLLGNSRKMDFPEVALMFLAQPGGGGPRNIKVNKSKGLLDISSLPKKACIGANRNFNHLIHENHIYLNDFDAILLAGVGGRTLRTRYAGGRVEYSHGITGISNLKCSSKVSVISREIYNQILEDWFNKRECLFNIRKIRSSYSGKLFIQQFPLPTSRFLGSKDDPPHFMGSTCHLLSYIYRYAKEYIHQNYASCNIQRIGDYPEWIDSGFIDGKSNDYWHPNIGKKLMNEFIELSLG